MVVEPTLTKALTQFAAPLAFLDFETVSLAVPRWPGCRPWQQVPVQFSVHAEDRGGLVHLQWIADGPEDPRPALAEALVEACAGARKVVAYHAPFERDGIKQLREAVPRLAKELERLMLRGGELPAGERAALRDALLRYCERDTWAMVKLLEKLRSLVVDQLE